MQKEYLDVLELWKKQGKDQRLISHWRIYMIEKISSFEILKTEVEESFSQCLRKKRLAIIEYCVLEKENLVLVY